MPSLGESLETALGEPEVAESKPRLQEGPEESEPSAVQSLATLLGIDEAGFDEFSVLLSEAVSEINS